MNDEVGSDFSGPHFPRRGEQWFECFTCGFDFPLSESRRHFRMHRLVCEWCDDEKSHSDFMEELVAPKEAPIETEQPVRCQGEVVDSAWYSAIWYQGVWYGEGHECEEGK